MILGTVYRFLGIYITTQENTGKPQPGDYLMKDVRAVIATNVAPYLHKEKEGRRKERRKKRRKHANKHIVCR